MTGALLIIICGVLGALIPICVVLIVIAVSETFKLIWGPTPMTNYADLVERLRWLSSPGGEHMSDSERIDAFCFAGRDAADAIEEQAARIAELEQTARRLLLEIDFMVEQRIIPNVRNDMIFVDARAVLEKKDD